MAEADDKTSNETAENEFDDILRSVGEGCVDSRSYYWKNYITPLYIYHSKQKFTYSKGIYYLATFCESLLVTWVGLEARVHRRIGASVSFSINCVEGNDPYNSPHIKIFEYNKVPPPVRRLEPPEVLERTTMERIDLGRKVHHRVHNDYCLEFSTNNENVTMEDIVVVVKVQTPKLLGGPHDHPLWDQDYYERRKRTESSDFIASIKLLNA